MTWMDPPAWPRTWHESEMSLTVADGSGGVQLILAPYPMIPGLSPDRGVLRRLAAGYAAGPDTLCWQRRRGVLRDGAAPVTVALSDGARVVLENGSDSGWRRRHRRGRITIRGRTYDVVHRSRRRTTLIRDDQPIAVLRRTGWYWRKHHGDAPSRHRVRISTPSLGGDDELVVALAGSVLGAPGRPGWWAHFWAEFTPSL